MLAILRYLGVDIEVITVNFKPPNKYIIRDQYYG